MFKISTRSRLAGLVANGQKSQMTASKRIGVNKAFHSASSKECFFFWPQHYINGDRYRAIITKFFIPELNNHDAQELWFQQDGATCHTARATIDLLKNTFGDRLISRFGPVNWPPRSCDLTPLDYFLWGYVKSLVYADKPQTLDHLEDNIRRVISDILPQMLGKVIENWTSRLDYIRASLGSPMPEIIFKM
ncbi:transposable element Tc3 transposase [Trichonephila clavipes]|nr:transposable element Tc3 transposase [Trichonephila clavipes]